MSLDSFIKKYKVKNFYKYSEEKNGKVIKFGWVRSNYVDLNDKIVLSYPSKSKSFELDDTDWSNKEGVSAVGISDYIKYFKSLTSLSPGEVCEKWPDNEGSFIEHLSGKYKDLSSKDIDYILSLANLLENEKRFIIYGRIFKIVEFSP
tara:strand:+ start:356 stop:799 length:444 start_codon:yes stop_codon:yes gene_type:complete